MWPAGPASGIGLPRVSALGRSSPKCARRRLPELRLQRDRPETPPAPPAPPTRVLRKGARGLPGQGLAGVSDSPAPVRAPLAPQAPSACPGLSAETILPALCPRLQAAARSRPFLCLHSLALRARACVCVRVHVCMCVCVCVCICMCARAPARVRPCATVCRCARGCVSAHGRVNVCVRARAFASPRLSARVFLPRVSLALVPERACLWSRVSVCGPAPSVSVQCLESVCAAVSPRYDRCSSERCHPPSHPQPAEPRRPLSHHQSSQAPSDGASGHLAPHLPAGSAKPKEQRRRFLGRSGSPGPLGAWAGHERKGCGQVGRGARRSPGTPQFFRETPSKEPQSFRKELDS